MKTIIIITALLMVIPLYTLAESDRQKEQFQNTREQHLVLCGITTGLRIISGSFLKDKNFTETEIQELVNKCIENPKSSALKTSKELRRRQ